MYQLFALFTMLLGTLIPMQAPMNATLARSIGHPLWGAFYSLSSSALLILPLLLAFRVSSPNLANIGGLPAWAWFGGLCGAIYLPFAIILAPKLGVANFAILSIAGQIIGAMIFDHFGLFGLAEKPINLTKLLGAVVMVAGVLLVQLGNKAQ